MQLRSPGSMVRSANQQRFLSSMFSRQRRRSQTASEQSRPSFRGWLRSCGWVRLCDPPSRARRLRLVGRYRCVRQSDSSPLRRRPRALHSVMSTATAARLLQGLCWHHAPQQREHRSPRSHWLHVGGCLPGCRLQARCLARCGMVPNRFAAGTIESRSTSPRVDARRISGLGRSRVPRIEALSASCSA